MAYGYYTDLSAGVDSLRQLQDRLAFSTVSQNERQVLGLRAELTEAGMRFSGVRDSLESDPGLKIAAAVPEAARQADAFVALVTAADELVEGGLQASAVLLDFVRLRDSGGGQTLQTGIDFLQAQGPRLAAARSRLDVARSHSASVEDGLFSHLEEAKAELDRTISLVDSLIADYERATAVRP